jgi:hypothetical protein
MNVVLMMDEILVIANSVIREAALPDIAFPEEDGSEGMGVSASDELDGALQGDIVRRSEQQMDVFGHDHERMQLEAAFASGIEFVRRA